METVMKEADFPFFLPVVLTLELAWSSENQISLKSHLGCSFSL